MIEAFFHRPPHLNMDDYADWVEASLRQADPAKAFRLKAIQEQIDVPFRLRDSDRPAGPLATSRAGDFRKFRDEIDLETPGRQR